MHRTIQPILIACIVIVPFVFEAITFDLYLKSEEIFFTFSGARLWFFLICDAAIGFGLGRLSRHCSHALYALLASVGALFVLVLLLFYFCDPRACYYDGPRDLGWLESWLLFSAAVSAGMLAGLARKIQLGDAENPRRVLGLALSTMTVVALCYYPLAILYGTYQEPRFAILLLVYAAIVPSFLAGCVMSLFAIEKKLLFCVLAASPGPLLLFLFSGAAIIGNLLILAIVILAGVTVARISRIHADRIFGYNNNKKRQRDRVRLMPVLVVAAFFLSALHPFLSAPMNLEVGEKDIQGLFAQPTYYDGLSYSEERFPAKRVEVGIDFMASPQQNGHFVAGIGVQSPNCCKDGLDYGYRADVLVDGDGKRYLVARAWETCDQNIACGNAPWQDKIHEEIVPLSVSDHVELAMEMRDRAATWLYRLDTNAQWSEFSTFRLPQLGNPYFNVGDFRDIGPFALLSNFPSGLAHFYQIGIISSEATVLDRIGESVSFACPAYYDAGNEKHCMATMEPLEKDDSYWKVIWKWGTSQ